MNTALHHQALPEAASGTVPEWLHLLPAGQWRGVDGRGPYHVVDAGEMIAASMAAGKITLDENHATEYAKKTGQPSPARGWIDRMEQRADGIHGHVEWTPAGRALMAERAYRGISPVFRYAEGGAIAQITSAALTNSPNIGLLTTLHSQQDPASMDMTKLRAALKLPEAADEAAILGAIGKLGETTAAHSALVSRAAEAAGVTAADADGLVTALMTQRTAAGESGAMAGKLIAMQTELSTLKADGAKRAATGVVDAAIAAGKPILPLREHFIARHMVDPAAVETELSKLPSINAGGIAVHAQSAGSEDGEDMPLSDDEKTAARKMGVSEDDMKKQKKRMKEQRK
jgi:phage I-like protein